ncbi:DVUA0089 family protein, partial [Roseiconus lacunae]|uniref:DVUA0089 family protein n=1 Tax=Roseiconus lacunae TaxID=2605694 RepID=UPI001E46C87F
ACPCARVGPLKGNSFNRIRRLFSFNQEHDFRSYLLIDDVDVDVFALLLDGGGTFSATTVGLSDVDTRLYLFDSSGLGIYTNDDADVFTLQSTLPAGDALTPVSAGVYFLAITSFDIDPANASGSLFPIPLFPEALLGPTGPGGGSPVTGWDSFGEAGDYKIALTGASFIGSNTAVPEPSSFLAWSLAIATLGLRRR